MAEFHSYLHGNFDAILHDIDAAVTGKSITGTSEGASDFRSENTRVAVRVYERYSFLGKNRVSLSVTLVQSDGRTFISAITSGGSQAMLIKLNTFGEEAFLDTVRDTIRRYAVNPNTI